MDLGVPYFETNPGQTSGCTVALKTASKPSDLRVNFWPRTAGWEYAAATFWADLGIGPSETVKHCHFSAASLYQSGYSKEIIIGCCMWLLYATLWHMFTIPYGWPRYFFPLHITSFPGHAARRGMWWTFCRAWLSPVASLSGDVLEATLKRKWILGW